MAQNFGNQMAHLTVPSWLRTLFLEKLAQPLTRFLRLAKISILLHKADFGEQMERHREQLE